MHFSTPFKCLCLQIQLLHASFLLSKLFVAWIPIFNFTIITVFTSCMDTDPSLPTVGCFFPSLPFSLLQHTCPCRQKGNSLHQLALVACSRSHYYFHIFQEQELPHMMHKCTARSSILLGFFTRMTCYIAMQHWSAIEHTQRQWDLSHNNLNQRKESMAVLHAHI